MTIPILTDKVYPDLCVTALRWNGATFAAYCVEHEHWLAPGSPERRTAFTILEREILKLRGEWKQ